MTDQQNFPIVNEPIADLRLNGQITSAWRQFLLTIWRRTGGSSGGGSFDIGDMKFSASPTVPGGWLVCDGSAVSRALYAGLCGVIGTTWGVGDGVSTFNLPNLVGRKPIGAGGSLNVGDYGGADTVTLGVANLPAHNHPVIDPGHFHPNPYRASGSAQTGVGEQPVATGGNTGVATTGITTGNTGSGTPFNNHSPYAVVNYLIKF